MNLYRITLAIFSFVTVASFWVFSRLTVDDAFISWRYGKNFFQTGIWGYNPTLFDLTQAYTNPIYAALSIIPNMFGWDVVLFFKLFSLATLIIFILWFARKTNNSLIMLFIFLCLPATMVHLFSGLETFLFVFVLSALMISLYEDKKCLSTFLTIALFVIRPESWLLVIIVPLYFFIEQPPSINRLEFKPIRQMLAEMKISLASGSVVFCLVFFPLAAYLVCNYLYFGNILPNTFYVKSGARFEYLSFLFFSFQLIPLLLLIILGRFKLMICISMLFFAMIISYSTSTLVMDYFSRFAFHIFAPIYIFVVYLSANLKGKYLFMSEDEKFTRKILIKKDVACKLFLMLFYFIFLMKSSVDMAAWVTHYPREVDSLAALGKSIAKISGREKIKSFSFGDAGMVAYHSGIPSLDNIGLGSSTVARNGLNSSLLNRYGVDMVIFHAVPSGIRLSEFNQQTLLEWATSNSFKKQCDVFTFDNYIYQVYTRKEIKEISDVCESSKLLNNISNGVYVKNTILNPPWQYWKE
jgi:hypothetical protein